MAKKTQAKPKLVQTGPHTLFVNYCYDNGEAPTTLGTFASVPEALAHMNSLDLEESDDFYGIIMPDHSIYQLKMQRVWNIKPSIRKKSEKK